MSQAIENNRVSEANNQGRTSYIFHHKQGETNPVNWKTEYQNNYIGIGLLGSLKHPGVELNYSIADKYFTKTKSKKGKLKTIQKIRRWEAFTRYYFHRNFHHNIILSAGRTWQRSLNKNKFFISQADFGVARTFYTNPTFVVENGIVQRKYLQGDFYASFSYRFGFGKHVQFKSETYRFYSYFGLMNFAPFNNLYYSRLVIGLNVNKFLRKK